MSRTTCLTLRPTLEEFRDFQGLVARAEAESRGRGICKIVPPEGWWAGAEEVSRIYMGEDLGGEGAVSAAGRRAAALVAGLRVRPVKQCVSYAPSGNRQAFEVSLLEQRPMGVAAFRRLAREEEAAATRRAAEAAARYERRGVAERGGGDARRERADEYGRRASHGSESAAWDEDASDAGEVASRERDFWRTLSPMAEAPLYGADVDATTFGDEDACGWNLDRMQSDVLRPFLGKLGARIPGVTNGMMYFGASRAFFAWHVEDANLYSINYLHCGAPKSWYGLSPSRARAFEHLAAEHFAEARGQCKDFVRHKTTMFSPRLVATAPRVVVSDACLVECVQRAGDIVITFPDAYHAGFNHGFNVAESTNFATDRWATVAEKATFCTCQPDTVKIDVQCFAKWTQIGDAALVDLPPPPPVPDHDPLAGSKRPSGKRKPKGDADPNATGKRRGRCKVCPGCLAPECGTCKYCLDMPKRGGRGTMKKPCLDRSCVATGSR